jgi:hypothetical protein
VLTRSSLWIAPHSKLASRGRLKQGATRSNYHRVLDVLKAKYPDVFGQDDDAYSPRAYSPGTPHRCGRGPASRISLWRCRQAPHGCAAVLCARVGLDSRGVPGVLGPWLQARAFGRRLAWSALVPFADCLNHGNVQTKDDFDEDDNGLFRLFPTGRNRYAGGFKSCGQRSNANLLLDYGFALPDNEWDAVDLEAHTEPRGFGFLPLRHRTLILRSGVSLTRHSVSRRYFCWELLRFYRTAGGSSAR